MLFELELSHRGFRRKNVYCLIKIKYELSDQKFIMLRQKLQVFMHCVYRLVD